MIIIGYDEGGNPIGHRPQLDDEFRDHGERTKASDIEFVHIVPGDVFDDLAARTTLLPVDVSESQTERVIARSAESCAERPEGSAREDSAHARTPRVGRIERQPLSLLANQRVEIRKQDARFDRCRKIGRAVFDHAIHSLKAQHNIGAAKRIAAFEPRHLSCRNHSRGVFAAHSETLDDFTA